MTTYPLEVSYKLLDLEITNYRNAIYVIDGLIPIIKSFDETPYDRDKLENILKDFNKNLYSTYSVGSFTIMLDVPEMSAYSTIKNKEYSINTTSIFLSENSFNNVKKTDIETDTSIFNTKEIVANLERSKESLISYFNKLTLELKNIETIMKNYDQIVEMANDFNKRISTTTKRYFNFKDNFLI